jgi:DNA topoisomerase I
LKKEDVVTLEKTEEKCDKCGSGMIIKLGRFGKFLACSNYPECKNAKPIDSNGAPIEKTPEQLELERKLAGKKCDKCGKPMEVKRGRFGDFLGCSGYPDCKNIQPIVKPTGVKCPKCGDGQLIERRARKTGKVFYGCNKYPKCQNALWDKPTGATCKKCGSLMVTRKDQEICSQCDIPQRPARADKTAGAEKKVFAKKGKAEVAEKPVKKAKAAPKKKK